jgi:hypothetical protein
MHLQEIVDCDFQLPGVSYSLFSARTFIGYDVR